MFRQSMGSEQKSMCNSNHILHNLVSELLDSPYSSEIRNQEGLHAWCFLIIEAETWHTTLPPKIECGVNNLAQTTRAMNALVDKQPINAPCGSTNNELPKSSTKCHLTSKALWALLPEMAHQSPLIEPLSHRCCWSPTTEKFLRTVLESQKALQGVELALQQRGHNVLPRTPVHWEHSQIDISPVMPTLSVLDGIVQHSKIVQHFFCYLQKASTGIELKSLIENIA